MAAFIKNFYNLFSFFILYEKMKMDVHSSTQNIIERQKRKERQRERDRERDRQTDRHSEKLSRLTAPN